jgi:hypothetical protein
LHKISTACQQSVYFEAHNPQDLQMAVTAPLPVPADDEIPPPVYEVEEEPMERRIRSVPVPNDRRGEDDPDPVPGAGKPGG